MYLFDVTCTFANNAYLIFTIFQLYSIFRIFGMPFRTNAFMGVVGGVGGQDGNTCFPRILNL